MDSLGKRVCGAIGCDEFAFGVIDHPRHGRRTVCKAHAVEHPVLEVFDDDE